MNSPERIGLTVLPPLSLYVHMPWCVRKCPYCDFNSHELKGSLAESEYIDALVKDLELALPNIWGRRIYSVFFGGGTPSLFSAEAMDRVLGAFRARLTLDPDCEITMEANPGTFEAQKFRDYRAAGVNRLSIGIQSFNRGHLAALGRIHDDSEAWRAIEIASKYFENVNLDVMYALPKQTLAEAQADCAAALSCGTSHLSFYHLTLEPNTVFYSQPPQLPDDDVSASMQEAIETKLEAGGFNHYETSAFARPGMECKHNRNYWLFGDYLGIGAGAHSKISFPDRIIRQSRYKHPQSFFEHLTEGKPVFEENIVSARDLPFEFMMNALRLSEGFEVKMFTERTGLQISSADSALSRAEEKGLIVRDHKRIKPTLLGRRFLNDLLGLFLPDEESSKKRGGLAGATIPIAKG